VILCRAIPRAEEGFPLSQDLNWGSRLNAVRKGQTRSADQAL